MSFMALALLYFFYLWVPPLFHNFGLGLFGGLYLFYIPPLFIHFMIWGFYLLYCHPFHFIFWWFSFIILCFPCLFDSLTFTLFILGLPHPIFWGFIFIGLLAQFLTIITHCISFYDHLFASLCAYIAGCRHGLAEHQLLPRLWPPPMQQSAHLRHLQQLQKAKGRVQGNTAINRPWMSLPLLAINLPHLPPPTYPAMLPMIHQYHGPSLRSLPTTCRPS